MNHEEQLADLRVKYQNLETLVTGEMGLIKSVQSLQKSVDSLRIFQIQALTGFGILAVGSQIIIRVMIK